MFKLNPIEAVSKILDESFFQPTATSRQSSTELNSVEPKNSLALREREVSSTSIQSNEKLSAMNVLESTPPAIFEDATIAITVTSIDELTELLSRSEDQNFTKKITELDLSNIRFTTGNSEAILNFVNKCEFLTHLWLGYICTGVAVTIPESLTALKFLWIARILKETSITLQESLTHLHTFGIGHISGETSITIPEGLTALKELSIELIWPDVTFTIPESLIALQTLSFNFIYEGATVTIPESLTGLQTLSCRHIHPEATVIIPQALVLNETLSNARARKVYTRI